MAGKNKGGRETKKPKAAKNTKTKGQTPAAITAISSSGGAARR